MEIKPCGTCSNQFLPKLDCQQYCSDWCRKLGRKKNRKPPTVFDFNCAYCGVAFQHRKHDKKYCCIEHYRLHKKELQPDAEVTCKSCGNKKTVAYRFREQQYCSISCANSVNKSTERVQKVCSWCKSEFEVIQFRSKTAGYCSYECFAYASRAGQELNVKLICKNCGNEFEKPYIARNRTFCSKSCATTRENNAMFGLRGELSPSFGRAPWHKGLTAETDERLKKMAEKVSEVLTKKILDGTWQPWAANFKTGWFHSNKCDADMFYRSSYELRALEKLEADPSALCFEMEPFSIEYEHQGRKHRYIPDILVERVDGSRELIEVKPECLVDDEVNLLKRQAAVDWCQKMGMHHLVWNEGSI